MWTVLIVFALLVWFFLWLRNRKRQGPPKIKRRDLRDLRRDLDAWERGERPKLRQDEEE